jgi:ferritin-like protein
VQEMGHLISVQNLLLLVGGPDELHFGRDGIRAASPGNPIPLVLEPISSDALAKFVVAEMPADIPDPELRQRVDELIVIAKNATHATPHRVGALYAKLFWLFQTDDTPVPPYDLSPSATVGLKAGWHLDPKDFTKPAVIAEREATRGDWVKGSVTGFILSPVSNAGAARDLISAISEQGEGLGTTRDSHFFEFLELLDALEAGQLQITALPVNPVARLAPAPDAGTSAAILTPYAKLWAELFDTRYNLLLLDLWHGLATPNTSPTRKGLIGLAYANMHFAWELIEQLISIRDMVGATDAAPPFGIQFEDLPEQDTDRWRRHERLLAAQDEIIQSIRNSPEFQDSSTGDILDFDGSIRIGNIEQSDVVRRTLIQAGLST